MRNFPFLSEIVRAVLPSLWTVGFHCDTLLRYGSAIYKLPWEGDCFNPQCFTPTPTMWHEDFANFSWVCQPSSASENCPVGSPSEILLRLQGFSGHKEHIESNALVFHAKRCLQAVLEKNHRLSSRGCSLVCAMLFHAISFLYIFQHKRRVVQPYVSAIFMESKMHFPNSLRGVVVTQFQN